MNSKVLKTLEYNKIIEKLTMHASSPLGQDMCRKLTPMTNLKEIKKAQTETSDALARLWHSGSVSFSGTRDIGATLKRLEIGSCLSIKELLDISSVLNVTLRIKSFSRNTSGKALSGLLMKIPLWKIRQRLIMQTPMKDAILSLKCLTDLSRYQD